MKAIPAPMTLVMLAIFVAMVGISATYPPGAHFMTYVIGIPAIGLCLIQLVIELYHRRTPAMDAGSELQKAEQEASLLAGRQLHFEMPSDSALFADVELDPRERVRREATVWGYFLALIAAVLLFGFLITVPVFLITFLRFQAGVSWRASLLYGGSGAIAMYLLFEKLLKVSLHNGFVTDFIVDRLT